MAAGRCPSVPMSPEKATNVKSQRLPAACGLASLLNLRLDIRGLLMDSLRFRQPRLAISCTNTTQRRRFPVRLACASLRDRAADLCAAAGFAGLVASVYGFFSYDGAASASAPYGVELLAFCLWSRLGYSAADSGGSALSIAAVTSGIGAMPSTVRSTLLPPVIGDQRRGLRRDRPPAAAAALRDCRRSRSASPRAFISAMRLSMRLSRASSSTRSSITASSDVPRVCKHAVERLGLRHRAREAVEDETLARIGLARCAGRQCRPRCRRAPGRRAP